MEMRGRPTGRSSESVEPWESLDASPLVRGRLQSQKKGTFSLVWGGGQQKERDKHHLDVPICGGASAFSQKQICHSVRPGFGVRDTDARRKPQQQQQQQLTSPTPGEALAAVLLLLLRPSLPRGDPTANGLRSGFVKASGKLLQTAQSFREDKHKVTSARAVRLLTLLRLRASS